MKRSLLTLLAATAAGAGISFSQTATTTPVGYVTRSLSQGLNACGITLQTQAVASGTFDTFSGNQLTDNDVVFSPVSGRTYVLEITSGTLVGTIQEVLASSISGSTITTPDNLVALGLLSTDTYTLRVASTLEEVFGTVSVTSGGVLQSGISSTGADIVWVPTGPGTYAKYFLHTSGVFRIAGTTTAAPNIPLIYPDGFYIQKKGTTAASLIVTGEVKKTGTNSVLGQGLNLISKVSPTGLNLYNSGIHDDLQAGISATGADIVWIQQANLTFKKYFRHTSGNWRAVSAPTVDLTTAQTQSIEITDGFFIQKKGATASMLDLNTPEGFSSL